jgi:putative transposase
MKKRKKFLKEQKQILQTQIEKHNYRIPFNSFYNLSFKQAQTTSWFNIEKSKINTDLELKKLNNIPFKSELIKCKKVIILPNNQQKEILFNWFESYRKMYNYTLIFIRKLIDEKHKKRYNFRYIRTYIAKESKNKLIKESNINSHILDGAIKLACASYKSASTNCINGNIKSFTIRPIKQSKKSKIIDLEKCYFNKDGFCKNSLGKMETKCDFNFNEITSDCKLHYNKMDDRFTLLIPIYSETKINNNKEFISIDPGINTFLTGFTSNNICKIGTNIKKYMTGNLNKIDKLSKTNNKLSRKIINRLKLKSYNKVTDLHWKSINYLIKNLKCKHILIGNWSTKDISSNKGNLGKIYKRIASNIRFYEFLQKLKCDENHVNLKITDESFTSKICSLCGIESKIRTDRTLSCGCNLNLDRDINGCINILLKSLN